jgi:hypothetical protein
MGEHHWFFLTSPLLGEDHRWARDEELLHTLDQRVTSMV